MPMQISSNYTRLYKENRHAPFTSISVALKVDWKRLRRIGVFHVHLPTSAALLLNSCHFDGVRRWTCGNIENSVM